METNIKPSKVHSRLWNLHNRLDILLDDVTEKGWDLEALTLRIALRNIRKALEAVGERRRNSNGE